MSYLKFAYYYDKFVYDIDYKKWVDYLEKIFEINSIKPKTILDLGCGTGNILINLIDRGYLLTGIDLSEDMLAVTKDKLIINKKNAMLINQDMCEFNIDIKVDAIICMLDSINYVTDDKKLKRLFRSVHKHLSDDGIFVFDINTMYKFNNIFSDNTFYDISDDYSYIWQSEYDKGSNLCRFDLTFFVRNGVNYERIDELHYERGYKVTELKKYLANAGLKICNIYHELSFDKTKSKSERIFFVVMKNNKKI